MGVLGENFKPNDLIEDSPHLIDKWILSRLAITVKQTNKAFHTYSFALATKTLYQFWLNDLCDVYIEAIKPIVYGKNGLEKLTEEENKNRQSTLQTLYTCLEVGLKLLHPFMPYITEELYHRIPARKGFSSSIMIAPYPQILQRIFFIFCFYLFYFHFLFFYILYFYFFIFFIFFFFAFYFHILFLLFYSFYFFYLNRFFFLAQVNEHPPLNTSLPSTSSSSASRFEDFETDSSASVFYNSQVESEFEYVEHINREIRASKSMYMKGNVKKQDPRVFVRINIPQKLEIFQKYKSFSNTLVWCSDIIVLTDQEDPEGCSLSVVDENTKVYVELSSLGLDYSKEIQRLDANLKKIQLEYKKLMQKMNGKLYSEKVPLEVQQQDAKRVIFSHFFSLLFRFCLFFFKKKIENCFGI